MDTVGKAAYKVRIWSLESFGKVACRQKTDPDSRWRKEMRQTDGQEMRQ